MARKAAATAAPKPDATLAQDPAEAVPAAVEQPAPVEPEADAAPAPVADEPAPDLDDFIATHEKAAQAADLVVTAISYPDATPRHHNGVYSGFPIDAGPLAATYSDGSVH